MSIRVTTRHSEEFDILSPKTDLAKSPFAQAGSARDYIAKVTSFYAELGGKSMIWSTPEKTTPQESFILQFFAIDKPMEYLLEVEEDRVMAYVDEFEWADYREDRRATFRWSKTPARYDVMSMLIAAPIKREEVREVRRYRGSQSGHCMLVEKTPW